MRLPNIAVVRRVAGVELTQLRRSGVFMLLAVLVAGLLTASAVVAWRAEQAYERQRQRYQSTVQAQWDGQPSRHPHRVSHYGYLLFRPRSPLGFFDAGVTAHTGSTLFLEAHRQNSMNFADAGQADTPLRFGGLTMALVLQLIVPLVVFVAAAGMVAREREDGTLAVVLAQGPPWWTLLAGKALALFVSAVGLALPAAIAAAALLAWQRDVTWNAEAWANAGALALLHAAYFGVCAALGVLVSAWCRTPRDATLALVGLWLTLWVVVPRVGPALGAAAHDLPTRAQFEADVERKTRALGDSHNPDDPTFTAFKADVLARQGVTRVEDLPANYNGLLMAEGERLTTNAYREARGSVAEALARQQARVALTGVVSPYVAMRLASMALSGSGMAQSGDFERQAEDYRYALVQHLNGLHAEAVSWADDRYESTGGSSAAPSRKRIDAAHWEGAPTFAYQAPPPALAVTEASGGIGALAVWLAALAAAAARLRPRVV